MNLVRCGAMLVLAAALLAGCGRHDHAHGPAGGGHVHRAPHGGTLVEVGDHAYNLEIVRDEEEGQLRCYVLDAHAENFVRIAQPSIVLRLADGSRLTLAARADPRTGETVGDTALFAGPLPSAAGGSLDAVVESVSIRGRSFSALPVKLPASTP